MTNLLSDIITYVRRIVKTPSNAQLTDALIVDYINRFWLMDVDARIQLFDLKTTYQFQTTPGIDQYNMPLYSNQTQSQTFVQVPINLQPQIFPDGTAVYATNILSQIQLTDPTATLVPTTVTVWFDYGLGNETEFTDSNGFALVRVLGPFTTSSTTINYQTGDISFNFTAIPGTGIPVVASFTYQSFQYQDSVAMFPVYQGFMGPCFVNGIEIPFHTERNTFFNLWPSYNQVSVQAGLGNGTPGPYTLKLPFLPNSPTAINFPQTSGIVRGHVDLMGIMATGFNVDPPLFAASTSLITDIPTTSIFPQVYFTTTDSTNANVVISDSGVFLASAQNFGCLITQRKAPYGNVPLVNAFPPPANYSQTINTINYLTGIATGVFFPVSIPNNMPIQGQCVYYQQGIPRSILFYNNVLTLRAPPNTQYLVQLNAYLTPAAFFNTAKAVPFGYMSEYIARGAARKILSDVGDWDQFNAYEPLFKEQESLVHIRSQRQWTSTRSQTIYSNHGFVNTYNQSSLGV